LSVLFSGSPIHFDSAYSLHDVAGFWLLDLFLLGYPSITNGESDAQVGRRCSPILFFLIFSSHPIPVDAMRYMATTYLHPIVSLQGPSEGAAGELFNIFCLGRGECLFWTKSEKHRLKPNESEWRTPRQMRPRMVREAQQVSFLASAGLQLCNIARINITIRRLRQLRAQSKPAEEKSTIWKGFRIKQPRSSARCS